MSRPRRYLLGALAAAVLVAAVVWTSDWLMLRHKVGQESAFGEVQVHYRYAVHLKNKQIELRSEKPRMVECVESIFPHYSESPCWYLARHPEQIEEIDGGRWHFFYDD